MAGAAQGMVECPSLECSGTTGCGTQCSGLSDKVGIGHRLDLMISKAFSKLTLCGSAPVSPGTGLCFSPTHALPKLQHEHLQTGGEELRGVKQETWRRSTSQAGTARVAITVVVPGQEENAHSLGKIQVDGGFGKCSQ